MPRNGSTTQRGYGTEHRRTTTQLKADMIDGQPCARGGEPLYRWQLALPPEHPMSIDGEHTRARALGGERTDGLSCAHHNRSHGARLGNRLRGLRLTPTAPRRPAWRPDVLTTSRDW